MRRVALVMVGAVLALSGPAMAKDLAAGLRGTWTLDRLAMLEADPPPLYTMATPEKKKEIQAQMLKDMPEMVLELTATTATMTPGARPPQVATYTVTRTEKNSVWVDLVPQENGAAAAPAQKYRFELVGADTLKMLREGDPGGLSFKRRR